MSYVVFARKYRPQTLSEVIGQEAVVKILTHAIELDRVHHAYVFTGARGVGKTSIARILAKSLNCLKGPSIEPCGQCSSCREIANSSSPDVLEIDGASNTSVDNVRELRESVKYMPAASLYKIYIIDEVHMLSTSAFNALLKTLEEPPPRVLFIFATTEPHKIPITILSRCQRFDFRRVSWTALSERLRQVATSEGLQIDDDALLLISRLADGSVRDAMSLLDQTVAFGSAHITLSEAEAALGLLDRGRVRALLQALLRRDHGQVSQLVREAYQSGADLHETVERLLEAIRDLSLLKLNQGDLRKVSHLTQDELAEFAAWAPQLSMPDLQRLFNVVFQTIEMAAKTPFAHLVFEMGLLKACDLEPVMAVKDLLASLEQVASSAGALALNPPPNPSPNPPAARTIPPSLPASPLPSATAPRASNPDTHESFNRFVKMVRQLKPALAATLEHVLCERLAQEGIVLRLPAAYAMFHDMLTDDEAQRCFAGVTKQLWGTITRVQVLPATEESASSLSTAPLTTLAEVKAQAHKSREALLKEEARAHPALGAVLSTLGGTLKRMDVDAAMRSEVEDDSSEP